MIAITILATELGIFIVSDVAAGNSNAAARSHDAAAETSTRRKRAVAGDYAISHGDRGVFSIHTAATRSTVASNYATGQIKGRGITFLVGHHNARARTRARSATHVAAAHVDGRAVLGIDEVADVAIILLGKYATVEIKRTARINVDEPHRGAGSGTHDGTVDADLVPIESLGCPRTVRRRFGHVIRELGRNARAGVVLHRGDSPIIIAILNRLLILPLARIFKGKRRAIGDVEERLG